MTENERPAPGEVPCTYHPGVMTGLRCGRCWKPICPRCGVRTPVGLRCPECTGVRSVAAVRADPASNAMAMLAGLAVAVLIGIGWGLFPAWEFYWALLLGFGVAETMAKMVKVRHGVDLQIAGIAAVVLALIISRVVMVERYPLDWALVFDMVPGVADEFQLRIIPDGVYAALAVAIPWYRFR